MSPAWAARGVRADRLSITALEQGRTKRVLDGVTAQVSSWMRVPDNAMPMRVKANANYNNGRLATVQAEADNYDTAILLNSRGKISEGRACASSWSGRQGRHPSTNNDILESITRYTVLELLAEHFRHAGGRTGHRPERADRRR